VPGDVAADVHVDGAGADEFRAQTREPALEEAGAGHQQEVGVPALRDLATRPGGLREGVPVEDEYLAETRRQDRGRTEAGHARPHDDGGLADLSV
jgi:hypothetical protein